MFTSDLTIEYTFKTQDGDCGVRGLPCGAAGGGVEARGGLYASGGMYDSGVPEEKAVGAVVAIEQ